MISVAILTKNNQRTLRQTLESVKSFPVVLVDTGSTDNTLAIAASYPNVTIYHSPFTSFGKLRNLAASYAKTDWILALDSDEVLTELKVSLDPQTVYEFPFLNFYKGKQVKCCGWYPESHIRLYHKKTTSFEETEVHEGLRKEGLKKVKLENPIYHYPYHSIHDFLHKMQLYTSLFAKQNRGKKKSSFAKALLHASWTFFQGYLLQRGILNGSTGFVIATYNASTTFYKYLKLMEENAAHTSVPPGR